MKISMIDSRIHDLLMIEPEVYKDHRGGFQQIYSTVDFRQAGIHTSFVQDNLSHSRKGVLRGLHFQVDHPQAKLVTVIKGAAFDVTIDLRVGSPSYLKWSGTVLSEEKPKMIFIPEGFAHGFLALSDHVIFFYKCSDHYFPQGDRGVAWNDPDVGVEWPFAEYGIGDPILSAKDQSLPQVSEISIPFRYHSGP